MYLSMTDMESLYSEFLSNFRLLKKLNSRRIDWIRYYINQELTLLRLYPLSIGIFIEVIQVDSGEECCALAYLMIFTIKNEQALKHKK